MHTQMGQSFMGTAKRPGALGIPRLEESARIQVSGSENHVEM